MNKNIAIELTPEGVIEYDVLDKTPGGSNLGRAEFVFCPVIRRSRFAEIHIFRKQQRRADRHYIVKLPKDVPAIGFDHKISDFHKENLAPWNYVPCKEHKGLSFSIYVPDGTSRLAYHLSGVQTSFEFA